MMITRTIRIIIQNPPNKSLDPSGSHLATPPWCEHVPDPSDLLFQPSLQMASALTCDIRKKDENRITLFTKKAPHKINGFQSYF